MSSMAAGNPLNYIFCFDKWRVNGHAFLDKLRDTIYGSDDYEAADHCIRTRHACAAELSESLSSCQVHYAIGYIIRRWAVLSRLERGKCNSVPLNATKIDWEDVRRSSRTWKLFNSFSHKLFNVLPVSSIKFDSRFR